MEYNTAQELLVSSDFLHFDLHRALGFVCATHGGVHNHSFFSFLHALLFIHFWGYPGSWSFMGTHILTMTQLEGSICPEFLNKTFDSGHLETKKESYKYCLSVTIESIMKKDDMWVNSTLQYTWSNHRLCVWINIFESTVFEFR